MPFKQYDRKVVDKYVGLFTLSIQKMKKIPIFEWVVYVIA